MGEHGQEHGHEPYLLSRTQRGDTSSHHASMIASTFSHSGSPRSILNCIVVTNSDWMRSSPSPRTSQKGTRAWAVRYCSSCTQLLYIINIVSFCLSSFYLLNLLSISVSPTSLSSRMFTVYVLHLDNYFTILRKYQ
jgi:hypothetical protein